MPGVFQVVPALIFKHGHIDVFAPLAGGRAGMNAFQIMWFSCCLTPFISRASDFKIIGVSGSFVVVDVITQNYDIYDPIEQGVLELALTTLPPTTLFMLSDPFHASHCIDISPTIINGAIDTNSTSAQTSLAFHRLLHMQTTELSEESRHNTNAKSIILF